ncbi:MAG: hypothetical protein WBM44_07755 [Waterburya sp.]
MLNKVVEQKAHVIRYMLVVCWLLRIFTVYDRCGDYYESILWWS